MKCVLIEPPRVDSQGNLRIMGSIGTYKAKMSWPPLDLMIISGYLDRNGFRSKIIDANAMNIGFDDVKKILEKENPDIVIFTTSTSTILSDLKIANIANEINKDIKTVAIGTHVSAVPLETMKLNMKLDAVVIDPEPEVAVLSLIENLLDFNKTKGIYFRKGKRIIKKARNKKIMNLDVLGFPSHEKINLKIYSDPFQKRKPLTLTYTTRGCWHGKCIYCSCPFFFQPARSRSTKSVLEELEWIESLGIKEVKWFDAEFNSFPKRINSILDGIIKRKIDITWSALVRVDNLPVKTIEKMKKAGCHTLHVGIESANPEILKNIRKNISLDQARKTVENIKSSGLNVVTYFMLGLPGETKYTMRKTLEFAKELDPDATTFSLATPHPKTLFHTWLKQKKYLKNVDYSKYNPMLPPVYDLPNLKSEDIYKFMNYAQRDFYLRPTFIIKRALKTKNLVELENGIRTFFMLLQRY
jgi:anaerobic magnesium-protoporphyrin IX monomethyl ester cyclase